MKIDNEYGALSDLATEVQHDFMRYFREYIGDFEGFTIRELEYLAVTGIHARASEMVLEQAARMRKRAIELSNLEITRVVVWDNGMVMVFDSNGKQVPEYQGLVDDVRERLSKIVPESRWERLSYREVFP